MSSVVISGDTSGAITLAAPAVAGTNTITLPAATGTVALTSQITSRSGITTVTLTSSAPSATLTSSSNQFIKIVTDTTVPVAPSIVLPDMTTMTAGSGYFTFNNATPFIVAIKDNGGTVREYLQPNGNIAINVQSIATSTGTWNLNNPPSLCATEYNQVTLLNSGIKVNSGFNLGYSVLVPLTTGYVALVWTEVNTAGTSNYAYAQLYGINTSTRAVTAYNRVTLVSNYLSLIFAAADSDNAGHALIGFSAATASTGYVLLSGLSVSGTTLYVTNNSSISIGACGTPSGTCFAIAYLGSSSAYALYYALSNGGNAVGSFNAQVRSVQVTGTTTVTVTLGTSQTIFSSGNGISQNRSDIYYWSRLNLTTFTAFVYIVNQGSYYPLVVVFTPASNSVALTTRTTYNRPFDIELQGYQYCAFMSGYSYCNGKTIYGQTSYDIVGSGATIDVVPSSSMTARTSAETTSSLCTVNALFPFGRSRTSYVNSGTSITSIDGAGTSTSGSNNQYSYFNVDPTSSAYNMVKAPALNVGPYNASYSNAVSYLGPVFVDSSNVISGFIVDDAGSGAGAFTAYINFTTLSTGLF